MSRIGKKPVEIPKGISIVKEGNSLTVKGPKGELKNSFNSAISIEVKDDEVIVTRPNDSKENRSLHGLTRALIQNMVTGVNSSYSKTLDVVGVGFRVEMKGKNLLMNIGYSHPIYFMPPDEITIETPTQTQIVITGIDKQLVGQVAAKLRSIRKPEPYKGKGIKYSDEQIQRKAGKTAGA
ncbi:MAG: 50S ribosomal protein L6 [Ignavibacteriales bacterium CG12_big_fil_rev_8_21_14_0_65_30_8]|nr:MAG: 50S ribosomal protein L6 [Ignavibacteriales bacterium CG12_big_fil_rev_8_21_14_0_65_30_8]